MTDYKNCDIHLVRRQYVRLLISDFFSSEASTKEVNISDDILPKSKSPDFLLTKLIDEGLKFFEERLKSYCHDLKEADPTDRESVQTLMNSFSIMENYLMQIYRNRMAEGITKDYNQTLQEDSHDWNHKLLHQAILEKIHPVFLQDVSLEGTVIMDSLIGDSLMTDHERESIIQEKTSRRRMEAFLNLMRGRLSYKTFIDNFIPAIQKDHPKVAETMKAMEAEIRESPPCRSVCAVCNMKETVQVKHLAEHLRSDGAISADMYDELRSNRTGNSSKWSALLQCVSNLNFITEAINSECPEIYISLKNENAMNLQCKCNDIDEMGFHLETFTLVTDSTLDVANLDDVASLLSSIDSGHSTTLRYKTFRRSKLGRKLTRNATYVNDSMLSKLPKKRPSLSDSNTSVQY